GLELVAERAGLGNPSIELGHRLPDRIAPTLVRRRRELAFELCARKPQRFERPHSLRVAHLAQLRPRAIALELLHPFLDPRILINKSFAGITHISSHYKLLDVSARTTSATSSSALGFFHPAVRAWFSATFGEPTRPQARGWPAIARGESTLILAPTGSGKTLSAFLWCLDRLMFAPEPLKARRC